MVNVLVNMQRQAPAVPSYRVQNCAENRRDHTGFWSTVSRTISRRAEWGKSDECCVTFQFLFFVFLCFFFVIFFEGSEVAETPGVRLPRVLPHVN